MGAARCSPCNSYRWAGGQSAAGATAKTAQPEPDDKLGEAIQDFFYAGRNVYVDFDPELWQTGAREKSREAAGLEMIKREYRLEHIRDSFYRILGRN